MAPLDAGLCLLLGLLPVLFFLAALILLDSYKLVRPRRVVVLLATGGLAALISLYANRLLGAATGLEGAGLARYVAPVAEELLKGLVIVVLVVRRRVGFLVDGAIFGFAVGAGFAAVENVHYLAVLGDPSMALWVIRGFGTALMHGSATATMAILSKLLVDRKALPRAGAFLLGWLAAVFMHSVFNHFFLGPSLSAALLLVVAPGAFLLVFQLSERGTREWLGTGFDTDAELLELIGSGRVSESRIGAYLRELRGRFPPTTVADMLCLLRLRLELSIQAKGILLARQAGFSLPPDPEVEERFAELRFLERSVGATGLLALKPVFHISDRDLWQYHMLTKG